MERGYVKIWRKSFDSVVFANKDLWYLWSWCLLKATYKTRYISVTTGKGEKVVKLCPGQFIFGRNSAASELKEKPTTIRRRIKKLEELGNISLKSDTHYTVISVCNWELYQSDDKKNGQATDTQMTGNGHPNDTNKKVKKVKNNNKTKFDPFLIKPDWFSEKDYKDMLSHRENKKAAKTERAIKTLLNEISKSLERGFTVKQCVDEMCNRNWTGFKDDWMKGRPQKDEGWT